MDAVMILSGVSVFLVLLLLYCFNFIGKQKRAYEQGDRVLGEAFDEMEEKLKELVAKNILLVSQIEEKDKQLAELRKKNRLKNSYLSRKNKRILELETRLKINTNPKKTVCKKK